MVKVPSREELEAAHCWLEHDAVPGDEELTDFRRAVRYHNAKWREANGYPIGAHRTRPGTPPRLIGSQLDRDFARETGATFLTDKARAAARIRSDLVEPHQRFDRQIFWADLLSSEALAVNLFGDLQADLDRADRAVHTWWPDAPGRVSEVRFYHSPGRFDPAYSNSLRSFDAMFVLDLDDGTQGAVAVDTKYREIANREGVKPSHLPRFTEIHDRSDAFAPGAVDVLSKSLLAVMWLEHVLLLSMLQHASGHWTWGRYVVVHPRRQPGHRALHRRVPAAARRRRDVRVDDDGGSARGQGAHPADDRGAAPPLHRQVVHSVAHDRVDDADELVAHPPAGVIVRHGLVWPQVAAADRGACHANERVRGVDQPGIRDIPGDQAPARPTRSRGWAGRRRDHLLLRVRARARERH